MINEKLILHVTIIKQVFKMSFTFIKFVNNLEINKFLFSFKDLIKGFLGCYKSLSKRLL
jgi:hypothetical protein